MAIRPAHLIAVNALVLIAVAFWHHKPHHDTQAAHSSSSRSLASDSQPNGHNAEHSSTVADDVRDLYLHTVKLSVVGALLQTPGVNPGVGKAESLTQTPYDAERRYRGSDWPTYGLTMIGIERLDNVHKLLVEALRQDVPGDFVECGVWRGGASLFAKAVLTAHGGSDRRHVHLVDSFQGLPAPTTDEGGDKSTWSQMKFLEVPQEQVMASFDRYGLLDSSVHFWKGYFRYSMPQLRAGISGKIALLRMDGDMFESTMDILFNAYDLVNVNGFIIIDDWHVEECRKAVIKFFELHGRTMEVTPIKQNMGAFFQKKEHFDVDMTWYLQFNQTRGQEQTKDAS